MKGINTNYTFTPVSKQVDFSTLSGFDIRHLTAIINVTANQIIYAAGKTGYGLASIAGSVITLQYDTTAMNSGDKLAVFYDATSISVDTGLSQPLTDTQLRATAVPVSGSVSVSNFPSSTEISNDSGNPIPVSGTVTANTGLSQPLTDTQLRASDVNVHVQNFPASVEISNDSGNAIPVSGTVSISNSSIEISNDVGNPIPVSGTVSVSNSVGFVSTNNSTTTLLGANAIFTGTADDLLNYAEATCSLVVDRNGTLSIEYSHDGTTWAHVQSYPITVTTPGVAEGFNFSVMAEARYFRIVYTNGGTAQGSFSIQTILKTTNSNGEVHAISQSVLDNTDALVVKGTIFGKTTGGGGGYVPVKVNPSGALTVESTVTSSALPTGASTSALQTTGNNSLASIDSKLQFEYGNDGRVRTGEETLLFFDQINGNVVNSELWKATLSGMALTQTNGTMVLNSGSALTANSYYNLVSSKSFNRVFEFPIYVATQFKYTVGNTETIEFGLLSASTNSAPTDGFFIRINSTGVYGVCNINGDETTSVITGPTANNNYYSDIVIYDKSVAFEIQDINGNKYSTSIPFLPSAASNARLGVSYRIYNGGTTATTASTLSIYAVSVIQMDWATEKPYDEQMSSSTHNFSQIEPLTFVKTANWTNNTQPSTATLSNTTAGYTTLGGYFRFSNLNGSNTDYALFAYQVPVGFSLVINGITVDTAVTTTLGATAGILSWAAGLGCSAVSLATTDSWPTSSAPKFVPLGMQGFSSASVAGTVGTPLNKHFDTPIVVEGGEYLHIILRVISGTGTGQYTGMVGIDGYFE